MTKRQHILVIEIPFLSNDIAMKAIKVLEKESKTFKDYSKSISIKKVIKNEQ